ncbi:hypothetical protein [Umezawaea sp. NPDC059074]|uniref:hypothetical protein n=1 Tax=Umezawaea sp. NPDC059074 TaxID=3346716 RepID=UPI00367569CD
MSKRGALATVLALSATLVATLPASATHDPSLSSPKVLARLDLAGRQQAENITLEPDGSADVTFANIRQVARISPRGEIRVLATLPAPPEGSKTPAFTGEPFLGGIVRDHDGTLYFNYVTGTAELTGIWKLRPGGTPTRVVALPPTGFANGLDLDGGYLYAADSILGTIWRASVHGGRAVAWSTAPELAMTSLAGVNGLAVHNGAVWTTNTDAGSVVRVPIRYDRSAGPARVVASGLGLIDDLEFTGNGDSVLVAGFAANEVVLVRPDGSHTVVLANTDGLLQNPTSLARRGDTVYVANAAYFTGVDPVVFTARLRR